MKPYLQLLFLLLTLLLPPQSHSAPNTIPTSHLPPEAQQTLKQIKSGGPFAYPDKDGSTFNNFEKQLPQQPRGYYREYTVPTPGVQHRGARRIVSGGNPPVEFYYTADHYRSFSRIQE